MRTGLFEKYRPVIEAPIAPVVRDPRLLMDEAGDVRVYYAPFEYLNPSARVVLVGITPGPTQMVNANNEARAALRAGKAIPEVMRQAKRVAAFSGEPMRGNLIRQLNHWGFHRWLGLADSAELFGTAAHLLQTTSLLGYPVFVGGDDYRGQPDMTRHPLLRRHLHEHFVEEVRALPEALFVGLGPKVQQTLDALVQQGVLPASRVVSGMLHPSGNCTYRINYLVGERREPVPHATNPVPYDAGRRAFRQAWLA
jgi:hypothetical protein